MRDPRAPCLPSPDLSPAPDPGLTAPCLAAQPGCVEALREAPKNESKEQTPPTLISALRCAHKWTVTLYCARPRPQQPPSGSVTHSANIAPGRLSSSQYPQGQERAWGG